jgi:hypothetical protein
MFPATNANVCISYRLYDGAMQTFTYIYYAECVLKLIGLGVAQYFGDTWCRFDFFLVCTAVADEFVSLESAVPIPPYLLRVMRVVRLLRILRLLKGAKELRNLVVTMILSFPSLVNVSSLLALVVFIYAVLGRSLFCHLATAGEQINEERNFQTLFSSMLLLFQVLTGDAWSGLMADAMLDPASGRCEEGVSCGTPLAIPYFFSFQVIGSLIFLNLVVAVILENFSSLGSQNPFLVSSADVEGFKEVWAEYDPDADNYIPSSDLPALVLAVPPPMGLKGVGDQVDARKLILNLSLTQTHGEVAFHEVLKELTRYSYKRQNKAELVETVEPLPSIPVPTLDTSSAEQLKLKRGLKPTHSMSHAELFAESLPSARRTFALQIIQNYASDWASKLRARKGDGAADSGPAKPNKSTKASFASATATEGLRRSRSPPPAAEATGPSQVARPTKSALRAIEQGYHPFAADDGGSNPSGILAVSGQGDMCSTAAGYAASHAQGGWPLTGQSYAQHQRKLQDALTEEVQETTPNERQAIMAAIKAQREAADASLRAKGRSPRPTAGASAALGNTKGGRGRDKVMC